MGLLDGNYEDERLTKKVKPAIQGGGYNYLGKQETVTVPKRWLSDPDHVVAELAYITPREAKVLRMRFGINMNTDHTLEEVGKQFDVTRERIRQIEAKALRKLRHPIRSRKLRDYLT